MCVIDHTNYFLSMIRIPNSVVIYHKIAFLPTSLHDFCILILVYHVVHIVISIIILQAV